jgi:mRNA-degrading endonuclease toxin of MazEF toxin-antitoxin module
MLLGDIWLVNLDPTIDREIRKTRPCAIVNDDAIGVLPETKCALRTGITGQDGSYLAELLLRNVRTSPD